MRLLLLLWIPLYIWSNTIDQQIEAIQKAPLKKRFEMMNAFKKEIIRMHEAERIKAIEKLKQVTQSPYGARALEEIKQKQKDMTKQRPHLTNRPKAKTGAKQHFQRQIENQVEEQLDMQVEEEIENAIENHLEDSQNDD